MLVVILAMGVVPAACPTDTTSPDTPAPDEFNLDKLLRKYLGPNPQTWGDGSNQEEVDVYWLDHSRFDTFKAELDAGGEYVQDGEGEFTRDWETGRTYALLGVKLNGKKLDLRRCDADNSTFEYRYIKIP
jgi:hypothetical protein